jgi:hypothetical protein
VTVRGFQAQVDGRRDAVRGEDGVAELEERVGAPIEAAVERVSEDAQGVEGFHGDALCYQDSLPATPGVTTQLTRLKRKLRVSALTPHSRIAG